MYMNQSKAPDLHWLQGFVSFLRHEPLLCGSLTDFAAAAAPPPACACDKGGNVIHG